MKQLSPELLKELESFAKGGISEDEYNTKKKFIESLKKIYGEECVKGNASNFRELNYIVVQKHNSKVVLYFRYSKEKGFYGLDKGWISHAIAELEKWTEKNYFHVYFMLDLVDEIRYFAIPVFFLKNRESGISVTDHKGKVSPQYKTIIVEHKGKYCIRFKDNDYEDVSKFEKDSEHLFDADLIREHDLEKKKFFENKESEAGLLRRLIKP